MGLKARIFEIKRFAVHDGDGVRTTVFFKGCPMRCVWCHNPEGLRFDPQLAYHPAKCIGCGQCLVCPSGAHALNHHVHTFLRERCSSCGRCAEECLGDALELYGREITIEELLPILLEDQMFYRNSGGGVTLSGGECLCQPEFCAELLRRLKRKGIHTAVDTCGAVPQAAFDMVRPYTDIFLYDIKAVDEAVHIRCTGRTNRQILENLKYLDRLGHSIEIRIPYVPDYNDDQMGKIAELLSGLKNLTKVRVLPYHNYAGSKYASLDMKNTLPQRLPTKEECSRAEKLFVLPPACIHKKSIL